MNTPRTRWLWLAPLVLLIVSVAALFSINPLVHITTPECTRPESIGPGIELNIACPSSPLEQLQPWVVFIACILAGVGAISLIAGVIARAVILKGNHKETP